jgi:hypothetical protein
MAVNPTGVSGSYGLLESIVVTFASGGLRLPSSMICLGLMSIHRSIQGWAILAVVLPFGFRAAAAQGSATIWVF